MEKRLRQRVSEVEKVVEEKELSEKAHQAVSKATVWLTSLVALVAWFWTLARQKVEELELSSEQGSRAEIVYPTFRDIGLMMTSHLGSVGDRCKRVCNCAHSLSVIVTPFS